jgi:hypothetical protein
MMWLLRMRRLEPVLDDDEEEKTSEEARTDESDPPDGLWRLPHQCQWVRSCVRYRLRPHKI